MKRVVICDHYSSGWYDMGLELCDTMRSISQLSVVPWHRQIPRSYGGREEPEEVRRNFHGGEQIC